MLLVAYSRVAKESKLQEGGESLTTWALPGNSPKELLVFVPNVAQGWYQLSQGGKAVPRDEKLVNSKTEGNESNSEIHSPPHQQNPVDVGPLRHQLQQKLPCVMSLGAEEHSGKFRK